MGQRKRCHHIETHYYELCKIRTILVGDHSKAFLNKAEKNTVRSVHDKFFVTLLGMKNPSLRFKSAATKMFTEFVKGITYFRNEEDISTPVYHRYNSCGDKTVPTIDALRVLFTNTQVTKDQKRRYLRNCFIEREVYNKIFQTLFDQQDVGHMYQIKDIEVLLQEYNGFHKMHVDVQFSPLDGVERHM